MSWKDISETVGKIAPMLGTVLGGPAGGAVGSLVASALGVSNEPDEVAKALQTDPDVALKLKELQNSNEATLKKHIEAMAAIELRYEETRVDERKSSHSREIELAKAGEDNYIQPVLAIIGVVSFFGMIGYMLSAGLNDMSQESSFIIGNMTGMAAAIAKDIYGYYFGSSKGSKDKTDKLGMK